MLDAIHVQEHDGFGGLTCGLDAALRAMLHTDAGVQDAQVIVHLRNGSDSAAWIARRGLLFDGDGRAQAANRVVLGLLHLAQKLTRVAGQALDVAALPLGIQRIERQ